MQIQVESRNLKDVSASGFMSMSGIEGQEDAQDNDLIVVDSRFGEVSIDLTKAIFFPQGLLGLPENLHFCLTEIPKENMGHFKLLQCLNDHALSFMVLPLEVENELIDKADILDCAKQINVDANDLAIMLIVSVQRSPEGVKVTANVRAPILVDVRDKAAIQYVFHNSKYNICHPLAS